MNTNIEMNDIKAKVSMLKAENERLCMELVEKDMLPARLRATITQQDELLNMHDAELERLRAALEEIKLLDEWHTKADAKDIARKALEQSDE